MYTVYRDGELWYKNISNKVEAKKIAMECIKRLANRVRVKNQDTGEDVFLYNVRFGKLKDE